MQKLILRCIGYYSTLVAGFCFGMSIVLTINVSIVMGLLYLLLVGANVYTARLAFNTAKPGWE